MHNPEENYTKHLSILEAALLLLLGMTSAYLPAIASAAWLLLVVLTIYGFTKNQMQWLWYGIAASPGVELWGRMSRAPFVPHEFGKYYLIFAAFLLLIHHSKRQTNKSVYHVGWAIMICLLPSLLLSFTTFDYEFFLVTY